MHRIFNFPASIFTALAFIPLNIWADPQPTKPACSISEDAPEQLRKLVLAYPDVICGASANTLIWRDGTEMPYETRDHSKLIDYEERLDTADLRDQTEQTYTAGREFETPSENMDPGRMRYAPFFKKLYGENREEVSKNTTKIQWLDGKWIRVSTHFDIPQKLTQIAKEIEALPPQTRDMVKKQSGTFVWRNVKGSKRLSNHSFASAIDVGVEYSDYWKWNKPDKNGHYEYRNKIPLEVVEIFEKYGFIWGGKWYHFDTMHFEYRPEFFIK